jgi:hypothetical protein
MRTRHYINTTVGQKLQLVKVLGPSSAFEGAIYIDATGHILVEDSGFNIKATSTNTVTANSWFRIEVDWFFNASTGHINCDLFLSPASKTATESLNSGNINTGANWTQINIGDSNTGASTQTLYQTGLAASNKGGVIGPGSWTMGPIIGTQGTATAQGGVGSVKVGTGVHIHGVAATAPAAAPAGVIKEGAKVHGVAASATAQVVAGIPNAARVPGHAASATAQGGVGSAHSGLHIHGVAVSATAQGGVGVASTGSAAVVHGVAAAAPATGQPGSVHSGQSVRISGVSASATLQGGIGHVSRGDRIHGVAAAAPASTGTGSVAVGTRIRGAAASAVATGTVGFPDVPNVAATVDGVPAASPASGGIGHVHAVARVFGRAAPSTVAGGLGSPRLTSGNPNPTVIFDSVKKALGFFPEYAAFDTEILIYINAAISSLRRLGIGPDPALQVTGRAALWTELWSHPATLGMVQNFIFLSVKLAFDTPGTSFNIAVLEEQLAELESRLLVVAETISPPSDPFAA